ncbi:MAG: SRPBCC family protein [Gallionella sp.]
MLLLLCLTTNVAASASILPEVRVEVNRKSSVYFLNASFNTSLSKCAAYNYLTDYEAARNLPGVIESIALREEENRVKVSRTADERVLFFHVRLHSTLEYTEMPNDRISFKQLQGDSRLFQGSWNIAATDKGSTLSFQGVWEPDTVIPLFVIDYFAKNGLADKFSAIAQLAEQRKEIATSRCKN